MPVINYLTINKTEEVSIGNIRFLEEMRYTTRRMFWFDSGYDDASKDITGSNKKIDEISLGS